MTGHAHQQDEPPNRFPLSTAQEMWCSWEHSGAFGPRFIEDISMRVSGRIDVAALQGALDDVVRRHEILRTVLVRDAEPRYQQVCPPTPVPLHIRDLPPVAGLSRDTYAEQMFLEAEHSSIDICALPVLRAELSRFDDRDSVLTLITHHTVSDRWSMQLIARDLATFYTSRTTGSPADLPSAPQYRDFVAWEQARVADRTSDSALEYWRKKLCGARIFALPADHTIPELHTRPYSMYHFAVDAEVMAAVSALGRAMRSSTFMVLLAAFNVLAHQIDGTTDPVINAVSNGRSGPQFYHTVGPFLNFLPLRTDISQCTTFRDVVARTRETCLEAYSHEIPVEYIEREVPELMQPLNNPRMCDITVSQPQSHRIEMAQIADGCQEIRELQELEPVSSDIPGGLAWAMEIPSSGGLSTYVQYNLEDFDEHTIIGWTSRYRGILSEGADQPDREWKTL